MDLGLAGRTVLVTGGSRGLGYAIAEGFLKEGARVTICARDAAQLQRAAETLAALGDIHAIPADIGREEDVRRLVAAVKERYGELDVLVNNAGGLMPGKFAEFTDEAWFNVLNGKLLGAFRVTRHALPIMTDRGHGAIINLSGETGKQLFPNAIATGVVNAAMIAFTKYLSHEVAPRGIRVNSICPGVIRTEGWEERAERMGAAQGMDRETFIRHHCQVNDIYLGRWGKPEEVANAVVLLASDRMSYVTGHTLMVDGGLSKFIA